LSDDLADAIARQSDTLWGHLPEDEVGDDEPLLFKTDDDGRLMVRAVREDTIYLLASNDYVLRARRIANGAHVSMWCNRKQVSQTVVSSGNPADN
jgi:hypothetical protein